jgi:hypothetical protein
LPDAFEIKKIGLLKKVDESGGLSSDFRQAGHRAILQAPSIECEQIL